MSNILLTMLLIWNSSCGTANGDISVVSNGHSEYSIVTPAAPSKAESKAATVLQDYIQKISGVKLPVVKENNFSGSTAIFVGNTDHTSGPEKVYGDGYYIGTTGKAVYVRGGSGKGVLYGAYHLLDTYMHCRKTSGEAAFVPTAKTITLPDGLKDLQEPVFVYRESYYPMSTDPEYLDWHGLQRFEDLWGLWGHSFFKILPPDQHFAAHPEYYSLVNGKRQALQLCLSNEQVYNLTVAYFRKAIATHPDAVYWSISPEDGPGYCTCDQCRKADEEEGSHAGALIRFVNRVAAAFPEQQFTTLAYGYSAKAPAKTRPAHNVFIFLSTIDAYRQQPLQTIASAADFRKNLTSWSQMTNNLFIWDYTTQFTNYLCPFPDYANLQPNMAYFKANHVKGVFSQGSGETYGDMAEYNSYVQAALLWNQDADIKAVTADFMQSHYKAAAPYIQQYVQALTNAVQQTHAVLDIYGSPVYSAKDYLSPAKIDQYSSLLDKAEAAVEQDPVALKHVYKARLSLEYAVLQQSRTYGTEKYGYLMPSGNTYVVNPRWPQRVQQFVTNSKAAGVTELAEGGLSPDAYQQEWAKLLAQQFIGGLAFRAPVTLVNPYTPEYSPMKEKTLTDGLFGTTDFSYNWLFTYGKDMVATIDLGSSKPVKSVSMNFLEDARHYIFVPVSIKVETSDDGSNYKVFGTKQIPVPGEDFTASISHYLFTGAVNSRYIRVTAVCAPHLPEWRAVSSKQASLCCDEIVVQ
ncbi:DUF4838 domain-containing protein [Chitinophaga sp. Cy-1792]|uniref:DUF4838 domain-containing protein n=1 Tax=Chitinophaga sp. Cy-1792 TaxID=2608339 RepID=UPI00141FC03A|nr:DUF4838 domain-containing protein [Chitinophaga sp. Cy-1792]